MLLCNIIIKSDLTTKHQDSCADSRESKTVCYCRLAHSNRKFCCLNKVLPRKHFPVIRRDNQKGEMMVLDSSVEFPGLKSAMSFLQMLTEKKTSEHCF